MNVFLVNDNYRNEKHQTQHTRQAERVSDHVGRLEFGEAQKQVSRLEHVEQVAGGLLKENVAEYHADREER